MFTTVALNYQSTLSATNSYTNSPAYQSWQASQSTPSSSSGTYTTTATSTSSTQGSAQSTTTTTVTVTTTTVTVTAIPSTSSTYAQQTLQTITSFSTADTSGSTYTGTVNIPNMDACTFVDALAASSDPEVAGPALLGMAGSSIGPEGAIAGAVAGFILGITFPIWGHVVACH